MLTAVATGALLPLTLVATLPAQAEPAGTRETVTLKISRDCVATVTARWTKEPETPISPVVAVRDNTNGNDNEASGPGPFKTTDSLTVKFAMDPSDTPHVIYGQFESDLGPLITTSEQSVNCAVRYVGP
jgi:hypothetical protein